MAKRALIIVDMLNDFVDEKGALYCGETAREIVPFVREKLETARKQGDAVIYLQDAHDEDDKEFEKFPKHCVAGSWGSRIIDALKPLAQEKVIPKKRFSGFYGTDLEDVIKKTGARDVEVVGLCTSICVMDTVGGLANRDYTISVPIKGVADFDPESHQLALKRMKQLYGAEVS
jgi:nicotinamidase-related amidase